MISDDKKGGFATFGLLLNTGKPRRARPVGLSGSASSWKRTHAYLYLTCPAPGRKPAAAAPMGLGMRAALLLCGALGSQLRGVAAQECPENSRGLGNGGACQCEDVYTGPLADPDDPTSGTYQLTFSGGAYIGPCSRAISIPLPCSLARSLALPLRSLARAASSLYRSSWPAAAANTSPAPPQHAPTATRGPGARVRSAGRAPSKTARR
jgi:hypothetical protein